MQELTKRLADVGVLQRGRAWPPHRVLVSEEILWPERIQPEDLVTIIADWASAGKHTHENGLSTKVVTSTLAHPECLRVAAQACSCQAAARS